MITAILATITAAPRNDVQLAAPIAADTAVTSHAQANAAVAITGRAMCDIARLATAAASVSKTRASAKTLNTPIEEVIAATAPVIHRCT